MLKKTFFPKHSDNRMEDEGNLEKARYIFYKTKPTNLFFLLEKRFSWMNKFLDKKEIIYEIGCGAGFSRDFIKNKNLVLTDFEEYEWVDKKIDAMHLPFEKNSIDALICSHMIHHLCNPYKFFKSAIDCLKPGGIIIVSDINTSFMTRLMLRIMKHEGWSYDVDVFSPDSICNNPLDLWSANCAIPEMLFSNNKRFENKFKNVKIIHSKLREFLLLPISGGVISKIKTINLPFWILRIINQIDNFLVKISPSTFASQREVVIQKKLE